MKKFITIALATLLCLSLLAGCGEEVKTLTQQEAMQIAVSDAGYEVTQVTGIHAHEGEQDGSLVYQIHFNANGTEYTYLIHGQTGEILLKN
ncbi:MAG: PepSY domain-containing protein [Oscillospiraceae bacterium]|nr:PepSY domain-containing protein [Oscillospiraceae bacterium]